MGLMGDGGKGGVDDVVLCGLGEYLQPELLARKSHHYLILLITFIMVSIVHIIGIVRVHIQDSKPWGMTYLYFVPISQVDPVEISMHTKGFLGPNSILWLL